VNYMALKTCEMLSRAEELLNWLEFFLRQFSELEKAAKLVKKVLPSRQRIKSEGGSFFIYKIFNTVYTFFTILFYGFRLCIKVIVHSSLIFI